MMASTTKIFVIRVILGVLCLIAALFFLYNGSLSKMQFGKAETVKTIVFVSVSPLFLLLLVMASKFNPILEKLHHLNCKKAIVNSFLFAVICLLMFWIKNPDFGIHYSQHKNYSCVSQQVKTLSRGNAYNLFAVFTFSFLPLIVSWKRKETIELGYFSILLGLTMENSMEILGTYGPNLWYILAAAFCCIGLIFSRSFLKFLIEKRNNYHPRAHRRRSSFLDLLASFSLVNERRIIYIENCLASLLIAVGTFLLSKGSFFQDEFEGIAKWAVVFFLIMFAFLLLLLVVKAPTAIDMVAKACRGNYVVKTIVNCYLLAFVSGVNFLKKYPKFKMQSTIVQSCFQQQNGNVISFGSSPFDLYSVGLFALFSLIVASARQQPVEFGFSSFLLELTMDASIEMFGNDHRPKFGYLLGASSYCVLLIFMRSYHYSSIENADDEHDRILNLIRNPYLKSVLLEELRRPGYQGASGLAAASENILLKSTNHLRKGEREQERESSVNAEESNRIVHNAEERPVERKLSQTEERHQIGNSGNLLAWASPGLRKRKTTTSQSIISESKPELKKGHDNEDEFEGKQRLERKKLDEEEDNGSYQVLNNGQIIPEERAEESEDRKEESSPVERELTQREQECEIGESYNLGPVKHSNGELIEAKPGWETLGLRRKRRESTSQVTFMIIDDVWDDNSAFTSIQNWRETVGLMRRKRDGLMRRKREGLMRKRRESTSQGTIKINYTYWDDNSTFKCFRNRWETIATRNFASRIPQFSWPSIFIQDFLRPPKEEEPSMLRALLDKISCLEGISKVAKSFSRKDDKSLRKLKSALRPSFSEFQTMSRHDKIRWLQDIRTEDYSISAEVLKSLRQPRKRDCFRGKHLVGKKSLGKKIWNRRALDGKRKGR